MEVDSTELNAGVSGINSNILFVGDGLPLEWRRFMNVSGEKSSTK